MPFNYTELQGTDKIKTLYPKVNDIGNYLKEEYNNGNLKGVSYVDMDNVLNTIKEKGDYYVSGCTNVPKGETGTGFLKLDKRTQNYYKMYYTPYNLNVVYMRTMYNGVLSDWEKVKMDDGGIVDYGKVIDVTTMNESTIQHASLINPPREDLNEGWLNFTKGKNGLSIAEYNPDNSSSTFKKIQKQLKQPQNPNILRDAIFKEPIRNDKSIDSKEALGYWETYNGVTNPAIGVEYQGQRVVQLYSDGSNYPSVLSKPYAIGEDINIGDTITFSAYIYVPDSSILQNRIPYLDIAGYESIIQNSNPTIGQYEVTSENVKYGQWQRISVTAKVPSTNIEDKPIKYIRALLRYNCSENNSPSKSFYYALPKLEKSDKPTPFISHREDKYQFDEIWTQWLEYKDLRELNKEVPSDLTNKGFFDYIWDDRASGVDFQELVNTVPQGFHTFYCSHKIPGAPSDTNSVRGTIMIDHIDGDLTQPTRGVIQCVDNKGKSYVYYKDNESLTLTSNLQGSTFLWEGVLDLADTNKTVTLADDPNNYDYVDVSYYVRLSGTDFTKRFYTGKTLKSLNFREFNLADSGGRSIDFWEGVASVDGKTITPHHSFRLTYQASTNTTVENPLNTKGEIQIYKVVGIKSI